MANSSLTQKILDMLKWMGSKVELDIGFYLFNQQKNLQNLEF